ncbi:MAG: chromate resistance protein [Chloroflexi bacterium]|nr:chromate resistance protein [Chloroflexota bacterium]
MRWISRRNIHVDRTSCPWLIRKFIDPQAEFVFVDADSAIADLKGHTFDMRGAEYAHEGDKCTFQVMLARHDLSNDPALVEMGRIVLDADVPPSRTRRPESGGLDALIRGFQLSVPDDHEKLVLTRPLYDALYAYCQAKIAEPRPRQGAPRPRLRYTRRAETHLVDER